MKFDPQDQKEFLKILKMMLITSLIVQTVVAGVYFFGEKQTTLLIPMVMGLFVTGIAFVYALGLRD